MSALFHHLSKRRLFVSPDRNVATATCAQGPTWGGGEQTTFSRCANPGPGEMGTATPQSRSLHWVPLGHAANTAYLRPCSTVFASVELIVPGYAPPSQTCAHRLKKVSTEKIARAPQTRLCRARWGRERGGTVGKHFLRAYSSSGMSFARKNIRGGPQE